MKFLNNIAFDKHKLTKKTTKKTNIHPAVKNQHPTPQGPHGMYLRLQRIPVTIVEDDRQQRQTKKILKCLA